MIRNAEESCILFNYNIILILLMKFDVIDVHYHFVEQTQLYKQSAQILLLSSEFYLHVPNNNNNDNNKRRLLS
jgi:hypothetical protein